MPIYTDESETAEAKGIFGVAFTIDLFKNLITPQVTNDGSIDPSYPEMSYWIFDKSRI